MKKIIIALSALAAISTSALAERSWDIDNPPPGMEFVKKYNPGTKDSNTQGLTVVQPTSAKTFGYDIGTPAGLNTGGSNSR